MKTITRRTFFKQAALASAALTLSARSWSQVRGANEDIRVAVVGFRSRGKDHISGYAGLKGVRLTALCDVDSKVLSQEVEALKRGETGKKGKNSAPIDVEAYTDIRKLLDSKNVDVISIATPNHWHALATIWAIQAGKDVYVEKPVSHNLFEGRKMVEAARKYQKIVQAGTQSRSSQGIREAVEWVQQGNLGKIILARGLCYKPRSSIGQTTGAQPVPPNIDYDLWSGPAPLTPPRRNSAAFGTIHYDWHWFWNYGNGDLGNQGVHQVDIARWFLGEKLLAPRVFALGGRLGYIDDGETPNTLAVFCDYDKAPLLFEVRGLPEKKGSRNMDKFMDAQIGVIIQCEGGHVLVPSYTGAIAFDTAGKEIKRFEGARSHFENFIVAVRSRKASDLNAEVLEGHISAGLCHTANISYRLGKENNPEAICEQIKADKDAVPTFNRMLEHLKANEVDLKQRPLRMGQVLTVDPEKETFAESAANKYLGRKYRKPFVIPNAV